MPRKIIKSKGKKKMATVGFVKRVIANNIENKQTTGSMPSSFNSVSTNWVEIDPSNIAQGTLSAQRVGRQIKLKSLEVNCVMAGGQSETLTDDPYNVIRVVIGLWSGQTPTPLGTALTTIDAPIRKDLGSRNFLIKKLLDRYITFK